MRKIFLLFLLMITLQVSAQSFNFIPKLGMNISNVTEFEGKMNVGANVGVAGEWMFCESFGVEPGVFFSMQGFKNDYAKFNMNYINVPVYAKYYAYKGLYAFVGPQFSFNLDDEVISAGKPESIKDDVDDFDLGIGLGAGYQFDSGFMISAGYTFGLRDVVDYLSGKNRVIQINLGWKL